MFIFVGAEATFRMDELTGSDRPVKPWMKAAPAIITIGIIAAFAAHGRIAQPAHYNDFADHSALPGIPHAGDVLSNAGFALVAIWGWLALWPHRNSDRLRDGWPGYRLFLIGLLLTAFGFAFGSASGLRLRLGGRPRPRLRHCGSSASTDCRTDCVPALAGPGTWAASRRPGVLTGGGCAPRPSRGGGSSGHS